MSSFPVSGQLSFAFFGPKTLQSLERSGQLFLTVQEALKQGKWERLHITHNLQAEKANLELVREREM